MAPEFCVLFSLSLCSPLGWGLTLTPFPLHCPLTYFVPVLLFLVLMKMLSGSDLFLAQNRWCLLDAEDAEMWSRRSREKPRSQHASLPDINILIDIHSKHPCLPFRVLHVLLHLHCLTPGFINYILPTKQSYSPDKKWASFFSLKTNFFLTLKGLLPENTPGQYSCLENPMGGGAWWAAVHGVAKSRTRLSNFTFMHWRRKWQPTPVFLPGESQGWGSLVGCRLWGHTESDTTEAT